MADLDDFFAKKDKKKGKSKKFLSSEELVKQLEQTAKENELNKKPAKIEEESAEQQTEAIQEQGGDDEWKAFEEEKKADLSNLKLGHLNIGEDSENNQNYGGGEYDNENSQYDGDSSDNPWNKTASASKAPAVIPEAAKQPKAPGVYVPPSVTRQENALKARGNRKNAPDLQNEEFFPSLGTEKAPEPPRPSKKDGFEEVKHGGKLQPGPSGPASVSLGNTYSSLLSDTIDS